MSLADFWIKQAVAPAAELAVQRYFDSPNGRTVVQRIVDKAIHDHPAYHFMRAMQLRYLERAPGLTPSQAWEHARTTLADHLKGDRIFFGHPDYAWDADGAHALVDTDLTYWESA